MSAFIESLSHDPVERAIAARVSALLANRGLPASRREALIRQAQRELVAHRTQAPSQERVQAIATAARLPAGYVARSVQVVAAEVLVAAVHPRRGLVWIDVGAAPQGVADSGPRPIVRPAAAGRAAAARDPFETRRRELRR